MENEIWIPIRDYEGLYEVSNLGRIKSLPKTWVFPNGGKRSHNGMIMKFKKTKRYFIIRLRKNNQSETLYVHRLVFESFKYKTDLQIDHIIEGNSYDNRLINLQPLNRRQNMSKNRMYLKKTSKYTGVSWSARTNKWQCAIIFNRKSVFLGYFSDEDEAGHSYIDCLRKYCRLSF